MHIYVTLNTVPHNLPLTTSDLCASIPLGKTPPSFSLDHLLLHADLRQTQESPPLQMSSAGKLFDEGIASFWWLSSRSTFHTLQIKWETMTCWFCSSVVRILSKAWMRSRTNSVMQSSTSKRQTRRSSSDCRTVWSSDEERSAKMAPAKEPKCDWTISRTPIRGRIVKGANNDDPITSG